MTGHILLIGALLIGGALGYFTKFDLGKNYKRLLLFTILVLLFFMGANLGFSENLSEKLLKFGYTSFIITTFAVFFSILVTILIVYLYNNKRANK